MSPPVGVFHVEHFGYLRVFHVERSGRSLEIDFEFWDGVPHPPFEQAELAAPAANGVSQLFCAVCRVAARAVDEWHLHEVRSLFAGAEGDAGVLDDLRIFWGSIVVHCGMFLEARASVPRYYDYKI